jgi:hypothetical protein
VAAGVTGFLSGGLAGDLLANALCSLARLTLGSYRPSLIVVAICGFLGSLIGAVGGAVAGVRLATAPRMRWGLVWVATCLCCAGFVGIGVAQQVRGVSLVRGAVLGGFSGFAAAAMFCAFLSQRRGEPDRTPSSPLARRTTTPKVGVGLASAAIVLAALFYNAAESSKKLSQGCLGVSFDESAASPAAGEATGVVVKSVAHRSGAEAAGIRAGDRIVALDNRRVETAADLRSALADRHPGETIPIDLTRDAKRVTVNVEMMDVFAMDQLRFQTPTSTTDKP